ncbi:lysylphosphatidylglycerol synthase domain-containing protein [Paraburkholderia sediminicola]|uniref:lysylphosphatidylglycerol synthase domain-containing protein n=1 Tax=Paraburkholderia sediminicola TaxID=458836 RepID=UPI0038B9C041
MIRSHTRKAAVLVALAGIGLAVGAPFVLNSHAAFAGLRNVSLYVFAALAASAAISAMAKAGKLHLMQTALGFRVSFLRTFAITLAADFAFLASPLGAAGYGVNIGLLQRAGASWSLATTVVGADQALDLAFFTTAVPVSLLFAFGPLTQVIPRASAPLVFSGLAGAACLMGVCWVNRRRMAAALDAAGRRVHWLNERRGEIEQVFP